MLEEQLKHEIATRYFKKFNCNDIVKRIDFSVKNDYGYLLWAEAKQYPTDIYKMLAQLLITIKADASVLTPPKFLGCFDNEKIAFVPYHDVLPVFNLNDFNWTQAPSSVDEKTIATVRNTINKNNILTFHYDSDDEQISNFILQNFNSSPSVNYLSTLIDKNNFIFVYQKWLRAVKPYIDVDFDKLKKSYGIYDSDFFLAELNIDDNGTTDISDDNPCNANFYITFNSSALKPYSLLRTDDFGLEVQYIFGFKANGKERYAEFWKLYKRPPRTDYWNYIIERKDLLVPQDVRERKGAFFTPQIWVELSQKYIASVLGDNWQDEYYVWDCCAGTGNLLNGLTNKYHIFASTLDQQDVDVMEERIRNGVNLLESHVFQFDFLNDDFNSEKVPQDLKKIIFDPEKRKKLVIYINPPYAEAGNARKVTGSGEHKNDVAVSSRVYKKYLDTIGIAGRELFAQFLIRISEELQLCKLAQFATLKALCASNFASFRNVFQAKLEKLFLVPAKTFDNVKGTFPIAFHIWDCDKKEVFSKITADAYNADGKFYCNKIVHVDDENQLSINRWMKKLDTETDNIIGFMENPTPDFQNNKFLCIINKKGTRHNNYSAINQNSIFANSVYLAVRHVIPADWLNDRDQFLYPNDGWKTDNEFQTNCLIYTLFHGQNRISCKQGVNHWIPFSEEEVGAKGLFDSHFMKDFLDGKIKGIGNSGQETGDLFADLTPQPPLLGGEGEVVRNQTSETKAPRLLGEGFGVRSKSVMDAGRALWRYYHTKDTANPNASLYDIKEFFQGRNDKGKMNATSDDPIYTSLLNELKTTLRLLGEEIKPKVYEYGFLR